MHTYPSHLPNDVVHQDRNRSSVEASLWPFVPAGTVTGKPLTRYREHTREIDRRDNLRTSGPKEPIRRDSERIALTVCQSLRNIVMPFEWDTCVVLVATGIRFRKWTNPIRTKRPGQRGTIETWLQANLTDDAGEADAEPRARVEKVRGAYRELNANVSTAFERWNTSGRYACSRNLHYRYVRTYFRRKPPRNRFVGELCCSGES